MMTPVARAAFGFVAINALLGAGILMLLPARTDSLFFWEVRPELNAGLFGALYLGGACVVGWVTYRGEWEPARFLVPILVTAGALISLTTLLHVDTFDAGWKLAYWLVVYIGAPLLALVFYVQQERRGARWDAESPILPATRAIAGVLGALLVAGGVTLIAWPGEAVERWPWPISDLMLRIFASWFAAFGAGLLWFLVEREWTRVRHVATLMIAAASLDLLMLAIHRGDITGSGASVAVYCLHLGLFGAVGALMHWMQRDPRPVPAADPAISALR